LSSMRATPGENLDPVKTLRIRYEAWLKAHPEFKR
jgi:hypothetical protein